jgi:hypothetical protein
MQLTHFRGLHYKADKRIQGTNNQFIQQSESGHRDHFQGSTANLLSKKYRVSPKTMRRAAQIAGIIDAIGEISPEAKRKILSEEVAITRKELGKLSSLPNEEMETIVATIEDGTYKRKAAAPPKAVGAGGLADSIIAAMQQLDMVISNMTNDYNSVLNELSKHSEKAELKTAIRSHIDALENLYRSI